MSTADTLAILDRATRPVVEAVTDLRAIREQWGDLLAAIERPPAAEWPPREARGFLDQLAAADHRAEDDDQEQGEARLGRMPLTLRQHPALLNLDALDAAMNVERALFDLADTLAAAVQRPVRRRPSLDIPSYSGRTAPAPQRTRMMVDGLDRDDPARWHYAAPTSPGSRAYGLHWAAVWIEGRVLGEDRGDLFGLLTPRMLDEAAAVARRARADIERALNRDGRTTRLETPCPWCGGELTGRTRAGGEPYVTCSTGEGCGAPVILDGRRRTWRGAELVGLWTAIEAAKQRAA
ncbi:hypothetical protein OG864_29800 [Streptomyces sp. NBC_00124]|uniref:hypothetical protein n=1 Tax=Streptomyces sp. NBC_00124 TaxID=2975662 RepID=UPI0022516D4D|nr:hypothetical protein [Streptomyces sp. NBC_00124]MCX5362896.1 hypothetical protein [Streptomyces sp. NBC_00124]